MKKRMGIIAGILAVVMAVTAPGSALSVQAETIEGTISETEGTDSGGEDTVLIEGKPYLALGGDLSASQQATVLELLGIGGTNLADYDVSYVTNDEEHQYLGSYISSDKIGSKSLSSVLVMEGEKGKGIQVTTKNITYCTVGMYQNALATAGMEDAQVIVAGPSAISGTSALVGALKAYEAMSDEEIPQENIDTALNELVVTGEIAESEGDSDTIEGVIAYVKQAVVANDLDSEEKIGEAIDSACKEFDVSLSEEERQKIIELMKKIGKLDLDADQLQEQAQGIYDKVSSLLGEDMMQKIKDQLGSEETKNFFARIIEKVKSFFASFWN